MIGFREVSGGIAFAEQRGQGDAAESVSALLQKGTAMHPEGRERVHVGSVAGDGFVSVEENARELRPGRVLCGGE